MASRRDVIKMSEDEVFEFLECQRVGVLGSVGPDGAPHVQGVMITGPTTIVRDLEVVIDITTRMKSKHATMGGPTEGTPEIDIARHAVKRVAVRSSP